LLARSAILGRSRAPPLEIRRFQGGALGRVSISLPKFQGNEKGNLPGLVVPLRSCELKVTEMRMAFKKPEAS